LDICISLVAVVILLPVFVVIAIAIRLTGKGPAIFRQERAGKDGKSFVFYKFRTISPNMNSFWAGLKS
jgi:lipopolysaccharide/colanic/teichoic acid biosynthesis glycosyltransferase